MTTVPSGTVRSRARRPAPVPLFEASGHQHQRPTHRKKEPVTVPTTSRAGGPRRRSRPPVERRSAPVRTATTPSPSFSSYEVGEAPPEGTTFAELGVAAPIVASLAAAGCATPFPIQAAT